MYLSLYLNFRPNLDTDVLGFQKCLVWGVHEAWRQCFSSSMNSGEIGAEGWKDGRTGIKGSIRVPRGPKNCSENPMSVRVGKDFALFKTFNRLCTNVYEKHLSRSWSLWVLHQVPKYAPHLPNPEAKLVMQQTVFVWHGIVRNYMDILARLPGSVLILMLTKGSPWVAKVLISQPLVLFRLRLLLALLLLHAELNLCNMMMMILLSLSSK